MWGFPTFLSACVSVSDCGFLLYKEGSWLCDTHWIYLSVHIFRTVWPDSCHFCSCLNSIGSIVGAFVSNRFGFPALEMRNVMVCECVSLYVWEIERGCLCCAFSAVLSGFGHSLPCEACRENVSHGVIMTSTPPHIQLPFTSSIFSPFPSPQHADPAQFFLYSPTAVKQDFFFSLHC